MKVAKVESSSRDADNPSSNFGIENAQMFGLESLLKVVWSGVTLIGPRNLEPFVPKRYRNTRFYFKTDVPLVALTIDDGLCRGEVGCCWARKVSALLRKHEARATFFVCSNYLQGVEGEVTALVQEGHEIGNHLEEDLPGVYANLTRDEVAASLARSTRCIEDITGVGKVKWFRAPQGMLSQAMSEAVDKQGLTHALGDTYADDWAMRASPRFVARTMLRQVKHGSICVTHMPEAGFREHTFQSLSMLLDGLTARGIKCVTLSALERRVAKTQERPTPPSPTTVTVSGL